ncbi:MAG: 50S ribosomal protein L19 [Candidatus Omnitrophica bacterium CG1_02_49_16]|nr:MAG: 50S ribosomal protein L19 [Candidatus Omnitrophica bacterium CG1_02_49_16]
MHPTIKAIEDEQLKKDAPRFRIGDSVRISVKVDEGDKTRTQLFEGVVIKKQGSGVRENFTVRRVSFGEGVERNFPLHSPTVQKVEVIRAGKVRRAKLFYLRNQTGKKGKIEEERKREEVPSTTA